MPAAHIRELSEVMEGRSDVIAAGALILREIMARYKFNEMIVSQRGVRYGLAIREWETYGTTTKEWGALINISRETPEEIIVFDGGLGTYLYEKGIFINTCFDELNLTASTPTSSLRCIVTT